MLSIAQTNLLLRQHQISPTKQRVDIARHILSVHQHFSADNIADYLQKSGQQVSKATIYNTLNRFVEKRLIRQVIVDPSKVFYDSNTNHHHHFYNEDSGELIDITSSDLQLTEFPQLPKGTKTTGVDVIIRIRQQS